MSKKLKFEVLPPLLWGKNIRSELGFSEWDIIRKKTYKKYKHTCCICGKTHMQCHAHEVWKLSINNKTLTGVQILVNVICVCEGCHNIIHVGRALANKFSPKVLLDEYARVNNITLQEAFDDFNYTAQKLAKLNSIKVWTIDLSLLDNDAYLKVFDIT